MRLLFLHTTWNILKPEYNVHMTLAGAADPRELQYDFVWQSTGNGPIPFPIQGPPDRYHFYDFGRDYSLPRPVGRARRLASMWRHFPDGLQSIRALVEDRKPDFLYTSQQFLDLFYARMISRATGIPHVIHLHYNVGPWLGAFSLRTIRKAKHLIAVSEFIRQNAMLSGANPHAIRTVLNPFPETALPASTVADKTLREEMGWPENTPVIVAVGRLDPGKGHLDLIQAMKNILSERPDARLLICGSSTTDYDQVLRQKVEALHLDGPIVFAGSRGDIPRILSESNVFCLPTQLEPCALVFVEAMLAGLPVVAYASGGVPEQVIQNETGLLSSPTDICQLSRNILRLLEDPALAGQMGAAGKERAIREFSPGVVAQRWLSVLESFRSPG